MDVLRLLQSPQRRTTRLPRNTSDRAQRFTQLVQLHADTVNRYLINRHRASDALEAEDLLAEVLAIAWKRFDDIPDGAEVAWLIGVGRNRLMNMRSKQARRLRLSAVLRAQSAVAAPAEAEAIADVTLREAIESLSPAERETFTLSVWEKLSAREIGIVMGVSENAVKVRLSKVKSALIARLGGSFDETNTPPAKR